MELRAELLCKKYGRREVVKSVSLSVQRGQIVGLLGPNGAGKTTCFYMLVGLIKADGGRVWVDERDITALPMYQRARIGIGYLPQESSIFRKLTVEENLRAGVDPIAVEDIQNIIYSLKRRNIGVLITDHNVQETLSITDEATLLFEGSILRQGPAERMAADPEVRRLYLGRNFEFKRKSFDAVTSIVSP